MDNRLIIQPLVEHRLFIAHLTYIKLLEERVKKLENDVKKLEIKNYRILHKKMILRDRLKKFTKCIKGGYNSS